MCQNNEVITQYNEILSQNNEIYNVRQNEDILHFLNDKLPFRVSIT